LSFGSVTTGNNQSLSDTITNSGGTAITVSDISATGKGYSAGGLTLPATLNPGQSASFNVTFAPTSTGSASGSVTITAGGSTTTVALSGTGTSPVGTLSLTPSSLAFGTVTIGDSQTLSGTLTASGGSITVTSIATDNSSVFSVGGISLPATISAGSSVSFSVTFSPAVSGAASATVTVNSNATDSTLTGSLAGTGDTPPTHSVDLSWNSSTSSDVAGYNIYRAAYNGSCGSYSPINSTLVTSTVYTDSSVTSGQSYCYAATAVNTSNEESSYSNILSNVAIPTP
jgi:hypothetical protein